MTRLLFQKIVIFCSGTSIEYLVRYRLRLSNDLFGIYVHHFREPDIPVFHDHPWNFLTLILRGGYTEHRPWHPPRKRRAGSLAYRCAEQPHYVDELDGETWTLVVRFRRRREWGFWLGEKLERWVPWQDYVRQRGGANSEERP